METKASRLLIGGFVLLVVVGILGFVLWLAKVEIDREFTRYRIIFEGSVSGLSTASDVLYNGIPVGTVTAIEIDPEDASRVRVTIEVASATPIREDSVATIELKGITGVSLVQISAGMSGPPLDARPGQDLPVIASKPSQFQELFTGTPEAINRFIVLVDRAARFLDEDNRQAIAGILADLNRLTTTLAGKSDDLDLLFDDLGATAADLRAAAGSVVSIAARSESLLESADDTLAVARGTLAGVDQFVHDDARGFVAVASETARSVTAVADEISSLVATNRQPFNDFSGEGLYEIARLVTEMRELVANLSRLAERIESDPARFIFGDVQQGFEAR